MCFDFKIISQKITKKREFHSQVYYQFKGYPIMKYVLDASALLSGIDFSLDNELYTSPMIIEEVKRGKMHIKLEYLIDAGLKILSPSENAVDRVIISAKKTKDIDRISKSDLEILSLAIELNATLLTDDYSIQNLASILKIKYQSIVQKGIKKEIEWQYRCKGCGRYWEKMYKDCPICGSDLKTTFKRSKNI